ncbi:MAG: hypothetical protein HY275_19600, partial [Gemmatimonadetes bacterium]|nr:hypothetical protein [Gemmatimonadota bacterium]
MTAPSLSIGIEEEYQIIDPKSRELTPGFAELVQAEDPLIRDIKPELHQCQVEIGTPPCRTIQQLKAELIRHRRAIILAARARGLAIASAGTHPISSWMKQDVTPLERYLGVKNELQDLAHRLLIFGTHVHVAIEDPEQCVARTLEGAAPLRERAGVVRGDAERPLLLRPRRVK